MSIATPAAATSAAEATGDYSTVVFDTPPEAALAVIAGHDGPVFVDLDETLYLRNTTEDFIDLARPALLAVLLLRMLEVLRPWRWSGGDCTRDVWRVQMVRLLFPWTFARWRAQIPRLTEAHANLPLIRALQRLGRPPVIATVGFLPIVTPLVAALALPDVQIVASRLNTFVDRRRGKLACMLDALGEKTVAGALLVTDSLNDLDLLQHCARGVRTAWPGAYYRPAFSAVYFPGQYISRIKRPGEHYLRRAVLQEDYFLWVLSSVALAGSPLHHAAGLLLLLLSFWAVYETGYVDNDRIAAKFEQQPALTRAFHESTVATPFWQPWIWSSAFAVAGIFTLRWPAMPAIRDYVLWSSGLVATALWFALYNRSNKPSRVWMYVVLQFARTALFALLVRILPIGAMALGAHILTRWVPYYIYRLLGKNWPLEAHFGIARLLVFAMLAVLLAISMGWETLLSWTTLGLLLWNLIRARAEIRIVFSKFSRVDRDPHSGSVDDRG